MDDSLDEAGIAREIGATIRSERGHRGMSMRTLAQRAGVSQPMVSNIENGKTFPGVPVLYTIARVLGVRPGALVPSRAGTLEVVRSGERTALDHSDERSAVPLVAAARNRLIEANLFRLVPGETPGRSYEHGGEDVIYVLRGAVTVQREGQRDVVIVAGESLRLEGKIPHSMSCAPEEDEPVEMLLISTGLADHDPGHGEVADRAVDG